MTKKSFNRLKRDGRVKMSEVKLPKKTYAELTQMYFQQVAQLGEKHYQIAKLKDEAVQIAKNIDVLQTEGAKAKAEEEKNAPTTSEQPSTEVSQDKQADSTSSPIAA